VIADASLAHCGPDTSTFDPVTSTGWHHNLMRRNCTRKRWDEHAEKYLCARRTGDRSRLFEIGMDLNRARKCMTAILSPRAVACHGARFC
jgi:hypothetical protein